MCASLRHRQIVTKWLYYPREHSTISNKYATCLFIFQTLLFPVNHWFYICLGFLLFSEINHIH